MTNLYKTEQYGTDIYPQGTNHWITPFPIVFQKFIFPNFPFVFQKIRIAIQMAEKQLEIGNDVVQC